MDHLVNTECFLNVAPMVPLSFHLDVLVGFQALELVLLWGKHSHHEEDFYFLRVCL